MIKKPLTISFLRLIRLQIAYAVAGCLFNLVSLILIALGQSGLTNTSPIAGLIIMAVVSLAALAGLKGYNKILLAINLFLVAPLLYSGVFAHLRVILSNDTASIFQAPLAMAMVINSFGVTVMTLVIIFFIKYE
jgi:hypothetical protein